MTIDEAKIIIAEIKKGKTLKTGHYHYGYVHLSYEHKRAVFIHKSEDLTMNVYVPEITFTEYDEQAMIAYLCKYYKYPQALDNCNY